MVNLLKELRPAILLMHSFGHKQQEIADALHISQQIVSKAINVEPSKIAQEEEENARLER